MSKWGILDLMKITIESPVFKYGNTADISDYCPNSSLSCLSKIFKRVVYNLPNNYFINQKILPPQQFGFPKDHSTEQIIAQVVHQIYKPF